MKEEEKSVLKYSKAQLCGQTADCPHSRHLWGRNTTTFKFLFHSLISCHGKDSGKKVDSTSYFLCLSLLQEAAGREGEEGGKERNRIRIFLRGNGEGSHLPIQSHICKLLKTKCPHSLGHYTKINFIVFISDTQEPSLMEGRYKNHRQAFLHE